MTDEERIEHLLENLVKLASKDFRITELSNPKYDAIDAIDRGIVMLGEQLEYDNKAQAQLLEDREILLREIHHRVTNNLQTITSLLSLQSYLIKNEEVNSVFLQTQSRINSMALTHRMLYQSENIASIKYQDYLEKLIANLILVFKGKQHNITTKIIAKDLELDIDVATPLGLLFTELITNSLKHAFPPPFVGHIYIEIISVDNLIQEIRYGDDGIGFEKTSTTGNSLGLKLIEQITHQLKGVSSKVEKEKGSHLCINFKK